MNLMASLTMRKEMMVRSLKKWKRLARKIVNQIATFRASQVTIIASYSRIQSILTKTHSRISQKSNRSYKLMRQATSSTHLI